MCWVECVCVCVCVAAWRSVWWEVRQVDTYSYRSQSEWVLSAAVNHSRWTTSGWEGDDRRSQRSQWRPRRQVLPAQGHEQGRGGSTHCCKYLHLTFARDLGQCQGHSDEYYPLKTMTKQQEEEMIKVAIDSVYIYVFNCTCWLIDVLLVWLSTWYWPPLMQWIMFSCIIRRVIGHVSL